MNESNRIQSLSVHSNILPFTQNKKTVLKRTVKTAENFYCISVLLPERFGHIALHLRHTTQCVLQRVLRQSVLPSKTIPETVNPSVGNCRFPEKLHRDILLVLVYTNLLVCQPPDQNSPFHSLKNCFKYCSIMFYNYFYAITSI